MLLGSAGYSITQSSANADKKVLNDRKEAAERQLVKVKKEARVLSQAPPANTLSQAALSQQSDVDKMCKHTLDVAKIIKESIVESLKANRAPGMYSMDELRNIFELRGSMMK